MPNQEVAKMQQVLSKSAINVKLPKVYKVLES